MHLYPTFEPEDLRLRRSTNAIRWLTGSSAVYSVAARESRLKSSRSELAARTRGQPEFAKRKVNLNAVES